MARPRSPQRTDDKTVAFALPRRTREQIKRQSQALGLTQREYVRRAIDAYSAQVEQERALGIDRDEIMRIFEEAIRAQMRREKD